MGQQQLLLLVLGIVIVGLAVVVGIQSFEENSRKAKQDRYLNELVRLAGEIVAWQQKPTAMGGNGGTSDMSDVTLERLGLTQTSSNSNSSRADYDDYRLILNRNNSARPYLQIHDLPAQDGSMMIQMALWGAEQACWAIRWRARSGGSWSNVAGSVSNPDSSVCAW